MKKLLITGDSFAADWSVKYKGKGWVNMLEDDYEVTNIAQAGVSEYKIFKQLESINHNEFDYILVSHTSAYRIPVVEHPIHSKDILHKNCDLIYSDLKEHENNKIANIGVKFFENLFDPDYFIFTYNLIIEKIQEKYPNLINITFFDGFKNEKTVGFEKIFLNNKGDMNHLNKKGNDIIYKKIKKLLNE
jgi:lysophospholipase L1-like esterase